MIRFDKALQAWGTADFTAILKQEIIALDRDQLPLQQALALSSAVTADPVTVIINRTAELESIICVRVGILYQGMIGGCNCTDDPTPVSTYNEYCELQLDIDKTTANTTVLLVNAVDLIRCMM